MKISVIMPTYRPGFLLTVDSLSRVNFPRDQWEFIFSDEIHYKRRSTVSALFKEIAPGLQLKHIQAPALPHFSIASTLNAGIKEASGELVVFMGDYTWMTQEYLNKAWAVHTQFQDAGMCGSYIDLQCPPLKEKYPSDCISTFEQVVHFTDMPIIHPDIRHQYVHNWIDENRGWLTGQHTSGLISIPRKLLLMVNGYDEMYDNGKGMDDFDMVQMCRLMGYRFLYDKTAIVYRVAHPHDDLKCPFVDKPHLRSHEQNKALFEIKLSLLNRGILKVWEHKGLVDKSRISIDGDKK